ncbi:secondary thiamine-phosphate synthase enzyme YjbQ [Nitrosophilus kaiyonis]|uniref:secondary thiamine-phosphate synthase enzyme YjbQ n=1 Tax=Nitrosophilus kaiyonis TaxID=2930200 RepID=UPI0024930CE7|nr:secondary thiamine-phosphate synthase enzyme YjbQ [Nitrosophilus kaiyonis]
MQKLTIQTNHKSEMIDITDIVKEAVIKSGITNGICNVFTPHTTTGIILFENVDPNLQRDYLGHLHKLVPSDGNYAHGKNAHAHIKSGIVGSSVTIPVEDAKPLFGDWQGVFYCEFDGPRERKIYIKVING